jgi:hypothetical protein
MTPPQAGKRKGPAPDGWEALKSIDAHARIIPYSAGTDNNG